MNTSSINKPPHPQYLNFSVTAWYNQDLANLVQHLTGSIEKGIQTYPERDYITLRTMLAKRNSLHHDNVVIVNGRTSACFRVAQAFAGSTATILTPSYGAYEEATKLYGWKVNFQSNSLPLEEINLQESQFCWLASPNTPDGELFSRETLLQLVSSHPEVNFVLDQSYCNFTTAPIIKLSDIKAHPNLIIIRSFTHAYGLPGLRVGYITAEKKIAQTIAKFVDPMVVNSLSVETVKYILIHPAQFTLPIRKWQRNALELMNKLNTIDGIEIIPSQVPFFLVRLEQKNATDVATQLHDQYGITVRDASEFRGLDAHYLRITARDQEQNEHLVSALSEILAK